MYKVFVNNKPFILTNKPQELCLGYGSFNFHTNDVKTIKRAVKLIEINQKLTTGSVYFSDLKEIWKKFCSLYKTVEAAGGIVINEKGQLLFIFRDGKWDLPKGKLERGEESQEGAVREVEEECNLKGVRVISEICATYHTYKRKNHVLKRTRWYEMTASDISQMKPQKEEGITDMKWFGRSDLDVPLSNTYQSIKEVVESYLTVNS